MFVFALVLAIGVHLGVLSMIATPAAAGGPRFAAGTLEQIPSGASDASECNAVLVWAHGLGDTHKGWSNTMKVLHARHPHVCILLPTAPVIPVTFGKGRKLNAWYDFDGTEIKNVSAEGDAKRISASAKYLQEIALRKAKSLGAEDHRRIIIGGFSQGAVISLHAGLTTSGSPTAGVVAVGGYMGAQNAFAAKAVRGLKKGKFHPGVPVLLLHGRDDDRVPPGRSVDSKDKLERWGVSDVDLQLFDNMGHGMNDAMLDALSEFITRVLPVDGEL